MKTLAVWAPAPDLNVISVEQLEPGWLVAVDSPGQATCPVCRTKSTSRHSSYLRMLRDLSDQGAPVLVHARLSRWRCRNDQCDRRIFADRLPGLAAPFARRTARLDDIVRLFGHSAGGRPSERLMARLGMPMSGTAILRLVKKRQGATQSQRAVVRVAGIDEWACRKGMTYGTIIVDLECHQVVDVLPDRSAATAADWFKRHPEIEVVSRDRAGLYADAARQGAPQARQVADRFHLLKNFRETIERQLGRFEAPIREPALEVEDDQDTPEQKIIESSAPCPNFVPPESQARRGGEAARQAMFDEIRKLYDSGNTAVEIARKLGLGPRRVYRWIRRIDLPELNVMEPRLCTPAYFEAFLARRRADGSTKVRHLFSDIRHRGYTGSFSHLARFLAPWRSKTSEGAEKARLLLVDEEATAAPRVKTLDPMTGRQISPLTAAALCVKPRGQMTDRQIVNVDALKAASADFTTMRSLAMRFRGLLRGGTAEKLDMWLNDAGKCGIYGMRRFVRTLRQDIEAVRNAVLEPWSNGQTEGQINKLKTFKRAMYGRASVDLLRARMIPLQ